MFHRHGAEAARAAHNREVTRSKRVAGIYHLPSFTETGRLDADVKRTPPSIAKRRYKLACNRHGAEVARGAHNSEVTRSKRVAGIFQFAGLQNLPRCLHSTPLTGVAQR